MDFRTDSRGQSTLVGFILLFGILTIAFSSYQAVVVPNQNAEVEFNHFQDVQDDFTEFRSALINSVGATDERSVTFRLGTQYPARLIALNPPPVSGQLQTTQEEDVIIDGEILDENIDSVCGIENPTTRSLTYTPNYNEFRSPQRITYENTFIVREFSDGTVYGEQQLFEEKAGNDQINLLLLNEPVSLSGQGTRSFEISPSNQRTVEVRNPTITIPSEFGENEWRNGILADVPDEALEVNRTNASNGQNSDITIEFDGDYDVSCVGPDVKQDDSDRADEGTESLFDTQWDENSPVTVQPDSSIDLTAKVIERGTNRNIDDATVDFAIEEGISDGTAELINADGRTDDGEATVTVDTKGGSGGSEFKVYVTAGDDSDVLTVEIEERGGPVFDDITAEPDDRGGTTTDVRDIEFTFSVDGDVTDRKVRVEGIADDGEQDDETVNADQGSANIDWGGGGSPDDVSVPIELTVELIEDDGSTIQSCTATIEENDGDLEFSDFTCN